MGSDACHLCRANHRRVARAGRRHGARHESLRARGARRAGQTHCSPLDGKARDGEPAARADGIHPRLGEGARPSEGENPARWRGHLDKLLPARAKVRKVEHHAALPYDKLPDFMTVLRAQEGIAARALEFAILTAARTGEVIGARWGEIDSGDRLWTVPAIRMKAGKEHRVPLSEAAVAILVALREVRQSNFVFPGQHVGRPLSNTAMLKLLKRTK